VALTAGGDLRAVVDSLLAELRDGLPPSGPAAGPDGPATAHDGPVPGPAACAGGHAA
jgi:carboxylate-amine ligase